MNLFQHHICNTTFGVNKINENLFTSLVHNIGGPGAVDEFCIFVYGITKMKIKHQTSNTLALSLTVLGLPDLEMCGRDRLQPPWAARMGLQDFALHGVCCASIPGQASHRRPCVPAPCVYPTHPPRTVVEPPTLHPLGKIPILSCYGPTNLALPRTQTPWCK